MIGNLHNKSRSAFFWDIGQRRVVIPYRRLQTGPETSVINYHSTLRKNLEERRSHLYRGGSMKSLA